MTYVPFISWKPCHRCKEAFFGELRLFEQPPGGFADFCEDGMPAQAWVWTCNVEKDGETLILTCGQVAPPAGSVKVMMALGAKVARRVLWRRQIGGKLVDRDFDLSPE